MKSRNLKTLSPINCNKSGKELRSSNCISSLLHVESNFHMRHGID